VSLIKENIINDLPLLPCIQSRTHVIAFILAYTLLIQLLSCCLYNLSFISTIQGKFCRLVFLIPVFTSDITQITKIWHYVHIAAFTLCLLILIIWWHLIESWRYLVSWIRYETLTVPQRHRVFFRQHCFFHIWWQFSFLWFFWKFKWGKLSFFIWELFGLMNNYFLRRWSLFHIFWCLFLFGWNYCFWYVQTLLDVSNRTIFILVNYWLLFCLLKVAEIRCNHVQA